MADWPFGCGIYYLDSMDLAIVSAVHSTGKSRRILPILSRQYPLSADSDQFARLFRSDIARDSDFKSPGEAVLLAG
jgi:hypothetical protein